jgi:hypothetical protein
MSDKTNPRTDTPGPRTPLAVEVYFDQTGAAAGAPLAPQTPLLSIDLHRRAPAWQRAPWAYGRGSYASENGLIGHIVDDGAGSTITDRPGDPWGFGSVQ